jgi:hypothetical protein
MATLLNHGLIGFTRKRIGLRPPTMPYARHAIRGASIHHGGPVGGPRMTFRAAQLTWREWQAYHQGKGWSDIGYTLGVDGLGRVYQGRPMSAVPAAVGGHNTGVPGINFMQDGRYHKLNALQRRTLKVLFEHGIPAWGLPPLKTLEVKGHQEYSGHHSNECPGGHIMRHLRWRRERYR